MSEKSLSEPLTATKDEEVLTNTTRPKRRPVHKQSDPALLMASTTGWPTPSNGLLDYITNPQRYDPQRVIYYDSDFVVINDLYPKSTVHFLIMPRDRKRAALHPFVAFEDVEFLAHVKRGVNAIAITLAADELRNLYGADASIDRDWRAEVEVGVHAHPSLSHLHVHVISKDRLGLCMEYGAQYNQFSTPFFVRIDEFPLARNDPRRLEQPRVRYLGGFLVCWKCGKDFNADFGRLKTHLKEEFEDWKRL